MRTLVALVFACMLAGLQAQTVGTGVGDVGFLVTSSDSSPSADFPLAILNGANGAYYFASSGDGAPKVSSGGATAGKLSGVSNSFTASYKATGAGIPVAQTWTLYQANNANPTGAVSVVIALTVGPQVSLTVTNTPATGGTAGSNVATSTAVTGALTTCGSYFLDCPNGVLYFQLYVPATQAVTCAVTITQVAATTGILQYPTSSVAASPYTAVTSAVTTANGATNAATTICASTTSGTNTLLYFISTYGSATGDAQTAAYNKIKTAAAAGTLNGNTAYVVANTQTTISGGTTAPNSAASSLTSVNKAAGRTLAVAGLLTTAVATFFGLAL